MTYLISIEKAKEEIARLQKYVQLIETYEPDTLEKLIFLEVCKNKQFG